MTSGLQRILIGLSTVVLIAGAFSTAAFAAEPADVRAECGFDLPEEQMYDAEVIEVRKQLRVDLDMAFEVQVFMQNSGNMPWFSNRSACLGPKMSLGTDLERDSASVFYRANLDGWESSNRIGMDQMRVSPGEIASFTFQAYSGETDDIYKQFLTPVLRDIQWLDDSGVYFELIAGQPGVNAVDVRTKLLYASESGSAMDIDLTAEKSLLIDRSDQMMYVRLGDRVIRQFKISSGAAATPTPLGTHCVLLKQDVRIGGKAPHYVMPLFQGLQMNCRGGFPGYGLHSLPGLSTDGGRFRANSEREIGRPMSHGCVRMPDEMSSFVFGFTEIGTHVVVQL
jgi:lipoprotein-anchoring transpeptidase ErfK/SrfK